MAWTFKEDRPIYSQLVEQIKMGIASWKMDSRCETAVC